MGSGSHSTEDWVAYASSHRYDRPETTTEQIYAQRSVAPALDPRGVRVRESRDSADNPRSTPSIIALDVTGSMTEILDAVARTEMGRLMDAIYDRRPVTNPHVMAMGIGDVECDEGPLQVTQFEADIRIAEQLALLWLEKGGGGNRHESYALAWYFAAYHTAIDSFAKRGEKGFLFTIGDERPTPSMTPAAVRRVTGQAVRHNLDAESLLAAASEQWDVYHVVTAQTGTARADRDAIRREWTALLGQRVLWLEDHRHLPELIVTAMQVARGASYEDARAGWSAAARSTIGRAFDFGGAAS